MNTTAPNNITRIRLFTALASFILSLIAVYFDDLINRDGILYMDTASAYLQGGLEGAAQHYNWPFFSIIIAYLQKLTTLTLQTSAYVITSLLFALLNDTLIRISHKLLPNKKQLLIAALFILCFQPINEYRDFIIRDIGYWAFVSLSLYYLILFIEAPTLKIATLWQLVTVIAVLFRLEGLVPLLGLPLFLFAVQKPANGLKHYLLLNYLFIVILPLTLLVALSSFSPHAAFNKINSVSYYTNIDGFLTTLNESVLVLKTKVLNKYSEDYAGLVLVSGLMVMLFYKLLKALGVGYIVIYLTSRQQKTPIKPSTTRTLLYYFLALNILILVAFVLHRYFITTRYTVLTLITLLLLMLPMLCNFLEKAWTTKNRPILFISGFILFFSLADSIIQSSSKAYIKNTAIWAAENLPKESKILTESNTIRYYAKAHDASTKISVGNLKSHELYDYTIVIKKKKYIDNKTLFSNKDLTPIFSQKNKKGDSASIYKRQLEQ